MLNNPNFKLSKNGIIEPRWNDVRIDDDGFLEISGTKGFKKSVEDILRKEKAKSYKGGQDSVIQNIIKSIEKLASNKLI